MSWVELERPWNDTKTITCPVCGKLIPRRSWEFADRDAVIRVCAPTCEELYVTYWRPRHGELVSSERSKR
jgi:hypothetical protein